MSHTTPSISHESASAVLLKLPHIAAWQIAHPPAKAGPDEAAPITATWPAMQRGAIWKPRRDTVGGGQSRVDRTTAVRGPERRR